MSKKRTKNEFLKQVNRIHSNIYEYPDLSDIRNQTKIPIICKKHGEFKMKTGNHINLKQGCPECSKESKISEIINKSIKKAKEIHNNKYDYSLIFKLYNNSYTKVPIICKKHGIFHQTMHSHLKGRGCIHCNKGIHTMSEWIDIANKIHYSKYKYINLSNINNRYKKIIIYCPDHGNFKQMAYSHLAGKGCPKCSHSISKGEIELKEFIERLGIKVETNKRNIIPPKEIDIYIDSHKIGIEYNGVYWHSEIKGCPKNYHLQKLKECNNNNIRLLQITDFEWKCKKNIVKSRIKSILGKTKYKIYGRKCTIKQIDVKTKNNFLNKYHIQGKDSSSIRLGAFYKNRLIAVMTFGKRRFDNKDGYELIRYATISNFSCVGVAGKLLKHFELTYNPSVIVSYADLRWSEGNLYKQLGFKHIHNSSPNYYYTKKSKVIGNRISFQKHKLKDKLDKYDPNMTEWENMKANGYDRIWDCGNMVFEKNLNK